MQKGRHIYRSGESQCRSWTSRTSLIFFGDPAPPGSYRDLQPQDTSTVPDQRTPNTGVRRKGTPYTHPSWGRTVRQGRRGTLLRTGPHHGPPGSPSLWVRREDAHRWVPGDTGTRLVSFALGMGVRTAPGGTRDGRGSVGPWRRGRGPVPGRVAHDVTDRQFTHMSTFLLA